MSDIIIASTTVFSGYTIEFAGGFYGDGSGLFDPVPYFLFVSPGGFDQRYRGLLQFNTSVLGAGTIITKVEFKRKWFDPPTPSTNLFDIKYEMGTFASVPPSFTAGEWSGGTIVYTEAGVGSTLTDDIWLDFGAAGISAINLVGYTSLKFRNTYNDLAAGSANADGWAAFSTATDYGVLRITYESPGADPISLMVGR